MCVLRFGGVYRSFIFYMSFCTWTLHYSSICFQYYPTIKCVKYVWQLAAGVEKKTKAQIRVGTCALVWSLWNYRNDIIFNKRANTNFFQVIRMATHMIHEWSVLRPEAQRASMDSGCSILEMVARDIYNRGGWRLAKRLQDA